MVDQDLMDATDALVGEVVSFDVISLLTGLTGLGTGLFAADFLAQLVGGSLADQSNVVVFLAEVLTKIVGTGVAVMLWRFVGMEFLSVFFGLSAVGMATSTILQVIEAAAETAARILQGGISISGMPESEGDGIQSEKAQIDDSGSPSASDTGGAQPSEYTV